MGSIKRACFVGPLLAQMGPIKRNGMVCNNKEGKITNMTMINNKELKPMAL